MNLLPTALKSLKAYCLKVLTLASLLCFAAPAFALVKPSPFAPGPGIPYGPTPTFPSQVAAPDPGYAIASWRSGRSDVFTRGRDGVLYHCVAYRSRCCREGSNSTTPLGRTVDVSKWENLGGVIVGSPAAVSWDNGRIDLLAGGTDDA